MSGRRRRGRASRGRPRVRLAGSGPRRLRTRTPRAGAARDMGGSGSRGRPGAAEEDALTLSPLRGHESRRAVGVEPAPQVTGEARDEADPGGDVEPRRSSHLIDSSGELSQEKGASRRSISRADVVYPTARTRPGSAKRLLGLGRPTPGLQPRRRRGLALTRAFVALRLRPRHRLTRRTAPDPWGGAADPGASR
jgi:hypothetical protein